VPQTISLQYPSFPQKCHPQWCLVQRCHQSNTFQVRSSTNQQLTIISISQMLSAVCPFKRCKPF